MATNLETILKDDVQYMKLEELFVEIFHHKITKFSKITNQYLRKKQLREKIGYLSEEMITKIFQIKSLKKLALVKFFLISINDKFTHHKNNWKRRCLFSNDIIILLKKSNI